jgi:hypothetical protein
MLRVNKSITVSTKKWQTGQTLMKFEETPDLKSGADGVRRWQALQIFGATELAIFNGNTVLADSLLDQAVLRLYSNDGTIKVQDLPLNALLRGSNGGYYYELQDLDIDLAQCEIVIQDATGFTANYVWAIEVIYRITAV